MQGKFDQELMSLYQKGETAAMNELLVRFRNPVFRFLYRLSGSFEEAQDMAQEVFLRVHEHRMSYQPTGKLSSWIFSIAHNLYVSGLRKRYWLIPWPRAKDDPDQLLDFEAPEPSPQQALCNDDFQDLVRRCISSLPSLQKEALILREYENMDYQEIAEILHKPLGTIKTLLYRARENLKTKLLPYYRETEGRI